MWRHLIRQIKQRFIKFLKLFALLMIVPSIIGYQELVIAEEVPPLLMTIIFYITAVISWSVFCTIIGTIYRFFVPNILEEIEYYDEVEKPKKTEDGFEEL